MLIPVTKVVFNDNNELSEKIRLYTKEKLSIIDFENNLKKLLEFYCVGEKATKDIFHKCNCIVDDFLTSYIKYNNFSESVNLSDIPYKIDYNENLHDIKVNFQPELMNYLYEKGFFKDSVQEINLNKNDSVKGFFDDDIARMNLEYIENKNKIHLTWLSEEEFLNTIFKHFTPLLKTIYRYNNRINIDELKDMRELLSDYFSQPIYTAKIRQHIINTIFDFLNTYEFTDYVLMDEIKSLFTIEF